MRLARLKRRAEFVAAATGARTGGRSVSLQFRPRGDDAPPRVGFTVTRKVGNAVERNRIRRRLRAAVERCGDRAAQGCDYVLVARRPAITISFEALVAELAAGFDRLSRPRGAEPSQGRARAGGRPTSEPTRGTTP
jgi:ribonuclease P protein component